jgi:hypothetical protein
MAFADCERNSIVMNSDHTEAWREYLVGQMHEQRGVARQEAQEIVNRWLCSPENNAAPEMAKESTAEKMKA